MAERVETIRLTAQVANYISGMQQAARETQKTASAGAKLAAQRQAFTTLGHSLLLFGGAVAAGVAVAVKSFADFDAQMSQVKTFLTRPVTRCSSSPTRALTMGQAIGFSASQVAEAEIELVKAGVHVSDIIGGALKGSLELAAAGQIDVGQATEIATIALTQFKLAGADVPHVADLLAAGADKALGGVSDLGEALKSGGLVASQFGVSLDETVGTLSAFANAGLIGETAGTDLRQALLKLANPSTEASDAMKKFGINVYDTSGKFVGMAALAGQLVKAFHGQTDATRNAAEATIFGSRAINGANVLYAEGKKGIEDWTKKVSDSGFAAQQAAGKMDNLEGDAKKLGAAFENDLIKTGSSANDVLRNSTQILTQIVKAYGDLPGPAQAVVLASGAVVAAIALTGGTALTAVPKIAEYKAALETLNTSTRSVASGVGLAGLGIAGAGAIIGVAIQQWTDYRQSVDSLADSLDKATGKQTKYTKELIANELSQSGALAQADKYGISLKLVESAASGNSAALAKLQKATEKAADAQGGFARVGAGFELSNLTGSVEQLNQKNHDAAKQWKLASEATSDDAESTQTASDAYLNAAQSASSLTDQVTQLTDTINAANGVGQDAVTANANYQKAIADSAQAVKDYAAAHGKSAAALDESTAAGSANVEVLADLAKRGQDAAEAQFKLDGNTDDYVSRLKATRAEVIQRAEDFGATATQAQEIADKVAAIPTDKEIDIIANTAAAAQTIDDFIARYGRLSGTIDYRATLLDLNGSQSGTGRGGTFANGGMVVYPNLAGNIYSGGAPLYKFAEPETGWEAFISGKPGERTRNRAIWVEAGKRLGVTVPAPAASPGAQFAGGSASGPQVPVTIDVHGETDPRVFAQMAGNAVAVRVRGVLRG